MNSPLIRTSDTVHVPIFGSRRRDPSVTDASFIRAYAGRFVVFEGPDGSGKSTQFRRLARLAHDQGVRLAEVREPGGTPVGERIRRHILLARADEGLEMSVRCEMLL